MDSDKNNFDNDIDADISSRLRSAIDSNFERKKQLQYLEGSYS